MEAMKGTPRQWYPYVLAVVCAIVFTLVLGLLVQGLGADSAGEGLGLGLLAAVGFIFTSNGINYAFEGRSEARAINCGYHLLQRHRHPARLDIAAPTPAAAYRRR